jgi:hypothetical protein
MNNSVSVAHLEQSAENETSVPKPKAWAKRLLNALLVVGVSLVALFFAASLIWKFSGSNQWEFVQESNGVKVYSLKAPGSALKQVKGIVQVRSTLASLVKFMQDPDVSNDVGFYESKIIERVDDQLQYQSFRYNFPFPFHPREYVVRLQVHQDPRTKAVLVVFAAAPDKAPPNNCCFRVTEMNNTWRFTPLENGRIEVEFVQNSNMGGFMPDLLLNVQRPKLVVGTLSKLQDLLDRKKYQDAKLDFIQEK